MNFLPEYQISRPDSLLRLAVGQVVVETLIIPKSDAPIEQILSISTNTVVNPAEVFVGEARYHGTMFYRVLYVDNSGQNHFLEHNVDFSDKFNHDGIVQATRPIFSSYALDTDTISVSPTEIRLATVVEVQMDAVVNNAIHHLSTGGEGIYTNTLPIDFSKVLHDGVDSFVLSDNFVDPKAIRTLSAEATAILKSSVPGLDVVVCSGTLVSNICFETEGGMFKTLFHSIPFVQEVGAPGVNAQSTVFASVDIKSFKVGECTEGGSINLEAQLNVRVIAFSQSEFVPVIDVFSVTHDLVAKPQSHNFSTVKMQLFGEDRVEGSVSLQDNLPLADTIMAVNGNRLNISQARSNGNSIVVEGVFSSNIVYYNADQNSKNSLKVELPFSISIAVASGNSTYVLNDLNQIIPSASVLNVTTRIRRGNEIDVRVDVGFSFVVSESKSVTVIKELEMGAEREL
ncbi:MAG: DUF3794 domain-containing protein, partial [Clostridiales bacterium]|nr:DUF3794 domain-containing protein [Clostridiales bacterium]